MESIAGQGMMPDGYQTAFASAERESLELISQESVQFAEIPLVRTILNGIPEVVVVLNRQRQIVFANEGIFRFLKPAVTALGLRTGEAFQCVHSAETWGGCGTTEFCRTCGAVRAILEAQKGRTDTQECRITRVEGLDPLDLRVWTTPLRVEGKQYTVFAAADISNEKRRHALERIFFHDVLNAAGGLTGCAELLDTASPDELRQFHDVIRRLSSALVEEIQAQRDLMMAENNELALHTANVNSLTLVREVADAYRRHDVARGKMVALDPAAEEIMLISDVRLLRRVLGNMVKNALEASAKDTTVTVGCRSGGEQVEFWVHNAKPMPRDVQLQIFQRSFTTKGNGRGLGTYSMKLLGERFLHGYVGFDTSAEHGTTFHIRLPKMFAWERSATSPS